MTTAATLWLTTVIGLCSGGGQLGLSIAATVLGVATQWLVKLFDERVPREQRALLVLLGRDGHRTPPDLNEATDTAGCRARFLRFTRREDGRAAFEYELQWFSPAVSAERLASCLRD